MNIGVFLALEPYTSVERQLELARDAGFTCADITDVHEGSSMFNSAGLAATVSLDGDPFQTKRLFEKYGITPLDRLRARRCWAQQPRGVPDRRHHEGHQVRRRHRHRDCVTTREPHSNGRGS